MKLSRIIEELERQGIQVTYDNIAIYAVFVSNEGLVEKFKLHGDDECVCNTGLAWLR